MAASPNNTIVTGVGASITDASNNVWVIDPGGQITVNGLVDPTTARVDELAYSDGLVWQKNADNSWYSKTSPTATWMYWANPGAPVLSPDISANNTTFAVNSPSPLVDANGNVWSLVGTFTGSGYQVAVDGAVDPTTANVVQLAYVNGSIWQENASGLWYSKTAPSSTWSAATNLDPLTGAPEPVSSTWVGGGDNLATDPADWSTNTAPAAGVQLFMGSGTMNVVGKALAGNTLNITSGATANINVSGQSSLKLATPLPGTTINVNVAADSKLTLNAHVISSNLNIPGGTISFVGSNTFAAFKTVLTDKLVGTGTLNLFGGNATGEFMEINGSVGHGLSFNISAPGPDDAGLQIDNPASFHGAVTLHSGYVAFAGVQATTAELLDGVLELFNGNTLVNSTRFTSSPNDPGATLQVQQNAFGVIASIGIGKDYQPGGVGTVVKLVT